jgi:hypothetical protein
MDSAGTRSLEAARWSHGRVTVLVAVLVTVLVTVLAAARVGGTGRAGGRSDTSGFPRAAPWEKASLTSESGERDQNPGNGSLCSRRHGRRQKTGAGTDGRGQAHPGGPRKPQAIASAPPSNGISSGISNGISSGILWRASRMAGADEGTRRPRAMTPPSPSEGSRLARVCFPRPDPDVSGGFPRRSGIALAMQSRGIHSRSARAQPGVSRDPGEGPGTESAVGAGRPDPGRFPGDPPRNPRGWARRRGRRPEEGARAPSTPPARGARGRHEGGGDRKSEEAPFGDAPARRG